MVKGNKGSKKIQSRTENRVSSSLRLQPTGLPGLDELLEGGIPYGSMVLLSGKPGTGKSILALQWLFAGARQLHERGIYITLSEPLNKSIKNTNQFEFFDQSALDSLLIHYTDLRTIIKGIDLESKDIGAPEVDQLIGAIRNLVAGTGAKRVVLDSLTGLLYRIQDTDVKRRFVFSLGLMLSQFDATALLISEVKNDNNLSTFDIEESITDGIIKLTYMLGEKSMIRRLQIFKMRGVAFRSGSIVFEINKRGVQFYPRIPYYDLVAKTDFKNRKKTGVAELDKMMGGGYPQGHMILIGGNTGTGKTTFAMQFLAEGVKLQEPGLFIALEETVVQIKKTALEHGWDLDKWEKEGKIFFLTGDILDINTDKLLYDIVNLVDQKDIKRLAFDSISSMESSSINKNNVREFLIQFANYLKSKGAICVFTYLIEDIFGAFPGQAMGSTSNTTMRLSSVVDGIILLRYSATKDIVKKYISILKMRGCEHSKAIKEFTIRRGGIRIKSKVREGEEARDATI